MPDSKSMPTRSEGSGNVSADSSGKPRTSPGVGDDDVTGELKRPSVRPSVAPRPGGAESLIGTILSGRYKIEKLLGEGGMGAVYQAEHTHMRKRLAVKVLHPEMSRLPEVVARFEREAMAAAHIDHPNVAAATDFGKLEDGSFFLVLEFVEGQSLRDVMNQGRLELGRALRILRQVAAALGQAHQLGIVHRDLKPENVMLVERGGEPDFVKVLDFGIAKVPVGEIVKEHGGATGTKGPVLTQLGMVYGTPEYMAPEQALGQNVDPRADIYAVGVLTYEMLAGVRPFDHESKVTLLGMHVTAPVPPIAQKSPDAMVPPEVEAIVIKMLAKEASARYADAKELIDAIDAVWTVAYGSVPGAPASMVNPRASGVGMTPYSGPISNVSINSQRLGSAPTQVAISSGSIDAIPGTGGKGIDWIVELAKKHAKPLIFGGLTLSAFMAVLIFKSVFDRSTHDVLELDDAGNQVVVTMMDAAPIDPGLEAQIKAATQLVDKGDYGTAISQLKALEEKSNRPEIHRQLEKAYVATQNMKDAMAEAKLCLEADPSTATDLQVDIRNAALSSSTQEAAFDLLENKMGPVGPDTLYNIGYKITGYPSASDHARRALAKSDVREKASPALAVTLELRGANSCSSKKALFDDASKVGDGETLAVLRTYTPTRGCGFLGTRDCWPCMHKDGSLAGVIHDIEARDGK